MPSFEGPDPGVTPGEIVSHYEIVAEVGRGGMAIVYRAIDLNLHRDVALKVPRVDRMVGSNLLKRFLRETRAASRLSHPNIVTLLDAFEHKGMPWLAMEFIEGRTLRSALKERGPLPVGDILRHGEGLADALALAHSKRILHRDVTPNNVLIGADNRARLADFGLARFYVPAGEESEASTLSTEQTGSGAVLGTPGYMSPEQSLGQPVDGRSDIFSLGAVLYEMCTARPAFAASERGDVFDAILHREPTAISRLNYEVPEALDRIIRKSLAKRPDERYQQALEMAADLRALRRRDESGTLRAPAPQPRSRARNLVIAAAGSVILGGAVLLTWFLTGGSRSGPAPLPSTVPHQITSGNGDKSEPKISPDGGFVAYSSDETGNREIYIADVQSGQTLRLTHDPGADETPAWLPEGTALVYASERGGQVSIWRVPRLGGAPSMLVRDALDPAISPDGRSIAFVRRAESGFLRVWAAPLADPADARPVSQGTESFWHERHPCWSPDGALIAFEDWSGLWLVPATGGKAHRLTDKSTRGREPAFGSDGSQVYFSTVLSGIRGLWRIPVAGGAAERVTLGTGSEGEPSLSRDGKRMAYATETAEQKLVLLDLASGRKSELSSQRLVNAPCFSPDGRSLFFLARPGEAMSLWRVDVERVGPLGPPEMTIDASLRISTFDLSPDGQIVAYHAEQNGVRDILTVPVGGGIPTNLTNDPPEDLHPAWSPDGRRLAFASDRKDGQHIWTLPMAGGRASGPPTPLTTGRSTEGFPRWSPDGTRIAYLRATDGDSEGWELWVSEASPGAVPGPPVQVTRGCDARHAAWTKRGDALLVSGTWGGNAVQLREVKVADGTVGPPVAGISIGGPDSLGDFAISPDGTMVSFVEEHVNGDIWVLESVHGVF